MKKCKACNKAPASPSQALCRDCRADKDQRRRFEQGEAEIRASLDRIGDDYAALKPEDYDVSVGNTGGIDSKASKEKRQEFSKAMGRFTEGLTNHSLSGNDGAYIAKLAEQEFRFGNRRIARSISISAASEALALRQFKQAAFEYLNNKVTPKGWAEKKLNKAAKRSVVALLSDWHLGADLEGLDEPTPFTALQEARRLEKVLRELCDYKPQHRASSEALLLLNGDMIEGQLMHDFRSGAPLTEQKVVFWRYMRQFIAEVAAKFPSVRVVCQPGNHGRDKVRHPGRATSRKWDGHEWELYYGLKEMCSGLKNVEFTLDFRAVSAIPLHGSILGMTHGDTEVKLGAPSTQAVRNTSEFDRINNANLFNAHFHAWVVGHFHTALYVPGAPSVLYNGMLVPPNGHARTSGYINNPCGQWLFEAVEGHPIGDLRYVTLDKNTDNDESLGKLITPFRFDR